LLNCKILGFIDMQSNSGSDSYSDAGFWKKLKNFALERV
jgi:hypothetical protein